MPDPDYRCEAVIDQTNPALLSSVLRPLFPPAAIVAELRTPGDVRLLLPAEAAHLGRSVPKRAQEFAAGRLCARRALAQLGIAGFAVEMAADRRPLWPASIVGSITHTEGFCAAVAAEQASLAAIGIDTEVADRVTPQLWKGICTAEEVTWLGSLPERERAAGASLIFSAKEAFYKCQYPLTRQFLGFKDVQVLTSSWGTPRGQLRIMAMRKIDLARHVPLPMPGEYLFHEQFVTSAFHLASPGSQ